MNIGNFEISDKSVFIIAELSANHRQSYELAEKSVAAAKNAGADAVKLQTYTADTITIDCESDLFKIKGNELWEGRTLYQLYQEAYTPWEWHAPLKKLANSLGMELFSTPFDPTAAEYLRNLNMPAYKIASFEIFDIPLIEQVARYGKPVIISTGMAKPEEMDEAVRACRGQGNNDIILLKCTSAYPAPIDKANLATMADMEERFGVYAGLSDHTPGMAAAVAASALGAKVIEKHFILDHGLGGPDAAFSLDPAEFGLMAKLSREAKAAVGAVDYDISKETAAMRRLARSLFVTGDMRKGDIFTEANLRSIRPGAGLHPRYLPELLGKRAAADIKKGTPMRWELAE